MCVCVCVVFKEPDCADSKAGGAKPFEPTDSAHGAAGFAIYPTEFWLCFGPVLTDYVPILLPFWNDNVYSASFDVGSL